MKNIICLLIAFVLISTTKAQTTAMDFTQNDCSGTPHHLFSELDSGNVIIMEFIMTCSSCIAAGHAIETMMTDLEMQYPGKVRLYQIAYTNSYTCTDMENFKNTNGFSSSTFDQGATMVAYYGGFGMPTVAIVGGTSHDVLYTSVGFGPSDTTYAGPIIRSFFTSLSVPQLPESITSFKTFPTFANDVLNVQIDFKKQSVVKMQIVNMSGKLISDLPSDNIIVGTQNKTVDVSNLSVGNYMLKVEIDAESVFSKFNIVR